MKMVRKVLLGIFTMAVSSSFAGLLYSQPFYSAGDVKLLTEFDWTATVESTGGVVEDPIFTTNPSAAIGVAGGNGAADVGAVDATWPDGVSAGIKGYPFLAPKQNAIYADATALFSTTNATSIAVSGLAKLSVEQRNDNTDSVIRFAIQVGSQWYVSAADFGGQNAGWTLKEMAEADFTDQSKWLELTVSLGAAGEITVGSEPASAVTGSIDAYGVYVDAGSTPLAGDHARFDNFQIYSLDVEASYVAATRTDWTDPAAWSDGSAAMAGTIYYASNSVVLETPATTATFPGDVLNLVAPQRMEIMATGADVITVDDLTMDGADLAAGVVDAGEAVIAGTISVVSNSVFSGATDDSRDLRVLSLVSGSSTVELSAPSHTIFIDNTNNTFSGTWVVSGGAGEFASPEVIGSADIGVSNGTLRVFGAWDGFTQGNALAVADSATASVDLGTNDWTVASLMIGTSSVQQFAVYTVAELNALGDAVFTGSGTLQVGGPPQPELLVGWERWVGGSGASCPATIETNGITGVAENGGFTAVKWGASNDGTFGTLLSPTASLDTAAADEGLRLENATEVSFDFTVANTTGEPVDLGMFHFDTLTKGATGGPDTVVLEVVSGDLSTGDVATNAVPHIAATGDLADFDVDLTGLADHTLDAGGSVVFRLSFSGGTPSGTATPTRLDMDNVAITKVVSLVPTEPTTMTIEVSGDDVIITWPAAGFKLQSRSSLTTGGWVDYPGGDTSPVTVPAAKEVDFFRLIVQ